MHSHYALAARSSLMGLQLTLCDNKQTERACVRCLPKRIGQTIATDHVAIVRSTSDNIHPGAVSNPDYWLPFLHNPFGRERQTFGRSTVGDRVPVHRPCGSRPIFDGFVPLIATGVLFVFVCRVCECTCAFFTVHPSTLTQKRRWLTVWDVVLEPRPI